MLTRKTQKVAQNQRVIMFKQQKFAAVLTTGVYHFWDFADQLTFHSFDINSLFVTDKNLTRLVAQHAVLQTHIGHWKLADTEVGLLYCNDLLIGVVAPGEHLYLWQDAGELSLSRIMLQDIPQLEHGMLQSIKRSAVNNAAKLICTEGSQRLAPVAEINVDKQAVALLFIDGVLIKTLTSGQYGFWQLQHKVEAKHYDLRSQTLDISGQEILSKDRVSLRINLSANIRIQDAVKAGCNIDKIDDYVYKTLQLALREAVGTKTLDDILLDKLYINATVQELVCDKLQAVGVLLENVGVKDIILPGEMKTILNQVVEAQKAAEANMIKRREETNATRSLHNTAKMMENNPTLMRLKELEALEKVAEKINNLTVYGGLENLMTGVVKIA